MKNNNVFFFENGLSLILVGFTYVEQIVKWKEKKNTSSPTYKWTKEHDSGGVWVSRKQKECKAKSDLYKILPNLNKTITYSVILRLHTIKVVHYIHNNKSYMLV